MSLCKFKAASSTQQAPGQPGVHSETLSHEKGNKEKGGGVGQDSCATGKSAFRTAKITLIRQLGIVLDDVLAQHLRAGVQVKLTCAMHSLPQLPVDCSGAGVASMCGHLRLPR